MKRPLQISFSKGKTICLCFFLHMFGCCSFNSDHAKLCTYPKHFFFAVRVLANLHPILFCFPSKFSNHHVFGIHRHHSARLSSLAIFHFFFSGTKTVVSFFAGIFFFFLLTKTLLPRIQPLLLIGRDKLDCQRRPVFIKSSETYHLWEVSTTDDLVT